MSALQSQESFGSAAGAAISVLVLDDDRFDRKRIARWVKSPQAGPVNLVEAADLQQFEQALTKTKYDLVIIDFCLADGNGLDAMDALVANAQNSSAFVVMVSGREDASLHSEALRYGCDTFISKADLSVAQLNGLARNARRQRSENSAAVQAQSAIEHWAKRAKRRRVASDGRAEIVQPVKMTEARPKLAVVNGQTLKQPQLAAFVVEFLDVDEFVFLTPETVS